VRSAGELTEEELESIKAVISSPIQFNIPEWFLNRQKDRREGKWLHLTSQTVDVKLREDFERMKKIRLHKGLRHYWNLRVRGQHTCSTGRHGRTVGLTKRLGM
jgi:small subunit ribosomal protein S18e